MFASGLYFIDLLDLATRCLAHRLADLQTRNSQTRNSQTRNSQTRRLATRKLADSHDIRTRQSRIIRPLSRAFKNILSPSSKAYLNVILDHKFSGIFRAVRSADKLIKAHCFPLE